MERLDLNNLLCFRTVFLVGKVMLEDGTKITQRILNQTKAEFDPLTGSNPIVSKDTFDGIQKALSTSNKDLAKQSLPIEDRGKDYTRFSDNLHKQFDDFIQKNSLGSLSQDDQLKAFVNHKLEQAKKIFNGHKTEEEIKMDVADAFAKDIRLARHKPELYGSKDKKIDSAERNSLKEKVLSLLTGKPQEQDSQIDSMQEALNEMFKEAGDPASGSSITQNQLLERFKDAFLKLVQSAPESERASILENFTDKVLNHNVTSMHEGFADKIEKFKTAYELSKEYVSETQNAYDNKEPYVDENGAAYDNERQKQIKLELSEKLGIPIEKVDEILNKNFDFSNIEKQSADLALEFSSVTTNGVETAPAAPIMGTAQERLEALQDLSDTLFNKKIPGPDGKLVPTRVALALYAEQEKAAMTGTPEEIEAAHKKIDAELAKKIKILDQAYATYVYHRNYNQAVSEGKSPEEAEKLAADSFDRLKAQEEKIKSEQDKINQDLDSSYPELARNLRDFDPKKPSLNELNKFTETFSSFMS